MLRGNNPARTPENTALTQTIDSEAAVRVARVLVDLSRGPEAVAHPDGVELRLSRQELARLVGCSREMAGRVLKSLAEDGMISVDGRRIVIHPQTSA